MPVELRSGPKRFQQLQRFQGRLSQQGKCPTFLTHHSEECIYTYIYINMFFFTSWNIGVQWFNFKNIPFGHAHAGQHGPAIVQIFTTMHVLRTTEETPLSNLMGSLNLSSYYVHKQVGTAETERASSLEHRMEFRHNYCE